MLSHENIIACSSACLHQLGTYATNSSDVMISYLPMAHMLERCCQVRQGPNQTLFQRKGCVRFNREESQEEARTARLWFGDSAQN